MFSDVLICIFNHNHNENAKRWLRLLSPHFKTIVLDSGSDYADGFIQYPNIYYSGLFNEMKKYSRLGNYDWVGQICSDVEIDDENAELLITKIKSLSEYNGIGIWQPGQTNNSRINWTYTKDLFSNNFLSVSVIEGWMHFIRKDLLEKIPFIDTKKNLYGYGIDIYESYVSIRNGFYNVRDCNVKVYNPVGTGYDEAKARYMGCDYLKELINRDIHYYSGSFNYTLIEEEKLMNKIDKAEYILEKTLSLDKKIVRYLDSELTYEENKKVVDWLCDNEHVWNVPVRDNFEAQILNYVKNRDYYHSFYFLECVNIYNNRLNPIKEEYTGNSKVSFIIPNRGGTQLERVTSRIKKLYNKNGIEIIIVTQEDEDLFKKGQLYNAAVSRATGDYIALLDNDIVITEYVNLIDTYKSVGGGYVLFDKISQVTPSGDDYIVTSSGNCILGFGAFVFLSKDDYINNNGLSNLCLGWGGEDNICGSRFKLRRVKNTLYHITHERRINEHPNNTTLNQNIHLLYCANTIDPQEDGIRQMTCEYVYDKVEDGVRKIGVKDISVVDNFSCKTFLNKHKFFIEMDKIDDTKKSTGYTMSVCAIGKNENRNIREFVEHYKNLGVKHIYLYDNNDVNGERFEEVISDYIESGFVVVTDYRGRKMCQCDAYTDCYYNHGSECDWMAFFDCDEFLTLQKNKDVESYLKRIMFKKADVIHVNWMIYGDNGLLEDDGRLLSERFTKPIEYTTPLAYKIPENYHVKSIVRTGMKTSWVQPISIHAPLVMNSTCVDASGFKCNGDSPFVVYNYSDAYLKHYSTKTATEYANKLLRGFPDQILSRDKFKSFIETRFFRTNEITQEKVDIFLYMLGVDMSYLIKNTKDGDVKIYSLCYSKKNFDFLHDSVVTPLQVGAATNNEDVCELKDTMGDSISEANFFFIENTGTYWIWQNVNDCKYKGQMQYRRPLSGVNETMNFEEIFSKYDVITCKPFNHPSHKTPTKEEPMVIPADTVEEGYAFSNCALDLSIVESIIKNNYKEYADDYDKYIKNGPDLYYSNGFILRTEDYNNYCMFLFGVLNQYLKITGIKTPTDLWFHVGRNLGAGRYKRYGDNPFNVPVSAMKWQTEIGGFLSERIWTLWLLHNFKKDKIYELPYIKMEEGMYT